MASYEASKTPRQHEEYLQRQQQNVQNTYSNSNSQENSPRKASDQQNSYRQQQNGDHNNAPANTTNKSLNRNGNDKTEFMRHNPDSATDSYGHQQQQQQQQPSSAPKSLSLEYGKTIKLLQNGNEFYSGQKVVINSRKYRYFDVFLDDISDSMQAQFGAVRNIHTPLHGHKIKSLDQFEDGKSYVASGVGRFKRLNYLDIQQGRRMPPPKLPTIVRTENVNRDMVQYDKTQNVFVYVYRNGDVQTAPAKVLLHKNTLASYDATLNEVTHKVPLQNGAVLKLYTMDGKLIPGPGALQSGNSYVATNKEKFKKCEYFPPNDFSSSPRQNRKTNSQPVSHSSSNASQSGKSNNSNSNSGKPYTGWHKNNSSSDLPPLKQSNNNSRNKVDVDRDDSGIYKAKNNNNNNNNNNNSRTDNNTARQVPDSRDMYVDKPVDHRKAQTVQDEIRRPPGPAPAAAPVPAKANSKQQPTNNQNNIPNAKTRSPEPQAPANKKLSENKNEIPNNETDRTKSPPPPAAANKKTNEPGANKSKYNDEEAAVKIQSSFRGYKTREELRKNKLNAAIN